MSDEEQIYKVDTVPPPPGEGDAYNAPTRVGAMPPPQVLEAMREAAATGKPLKPQSLPVASVPPAASATPVPPPPREIPPAEESLAVEAAPSFTFPEPLSRAVVTHAAWPTSRLVVAGLAIFAAAVALVFVVFR